MKIVARFDTSKWDRGFEATKKRVDSALMGTANMLASMLIDEIRGDIISSGRFGSRWTSGLGYEIESEGDGGVTITINHAIPFANVFQYGATINGNLWIPLSGTDAEGVSARDYPGGVFAPRVQRKIGAPLLFSITSRQPKYFGTQSVTIPPKWHIEDDVTNVLQNFSSVFSNQWNAVER
jgi:hypothetical protein